MSGNPHGATTIRASRSGGAGKWLILAIAALVLAGAGYLAWTQFGPNAARDQHAFNEYDDYAEEPLRAGPLAPLDAAEDQAPDEAQPAAQSPRRAAAPARVAAAEPVPEATIGVRPISVSSQDTALSNESEEVVVRAPRPVWTRTPSAQRLASLYPARALERGREGEARLRCTIAAGGALDCERAEETRREFGVAALRVSRGFRHATTRADGTSAIGAPVNLRVVFQIEDEGRRGRFAAR